MSQQELHIGELKRFERYNGEINTDYVKRFYSFMSKPKLEYLPSNINDMLYDDFGLMVFYYRDAIYYMTEHEEYEDQDINHGAVTGDSMKFISSFHNGGTCLSEMLEILIDKHKF